MGHADFINVSKTEPKADVYVLRVFVYAIIFIPDIAGRFFDVF